MGLKQGVVASTATKVGIYETDVLGVKAYHARCLECGWQTKRFDREKTAVAAARTHGAEHQRIKDLLDEVR
jgi:hypothetical protein